MGRGFPLPSSSYHTILLSFTKIKISKLLNKYKKKSFFLSYAFPPHPSILSPFRSVRLRKRKKGLMICVVFHRLWAFLPIKKPRFLQGSTSLKLSCSSDRALPRVNRIFRRLTPNTRHLRERISENKGRILSTLSRKCSRREPFFSEKQRNRRLILGCLYRHCLGEKRTLLGPVADSYVAV